MFFTISFVVRTAELHYKKYWRTRYPLLYPLFGNVHDLVKRKYVYLERHRNTWVILQMPNCQLLLAVSVCT